MCVIMVVEMCGGWQMCVCVCVHVCMCACAYGGRIRNVRACGGWHMCAKVCGSGMRLCVRSPGCLYVWLSVFVSLSVCQWFCVLISVCVCITGCAIVCI